MRCEIYIPLNAKDLTTELTLHPYGNCQNAMKFARANNSSILQVLKPGFTSNTESLISSSQNLFLGIVHFTVVTAI